MQKRTLFTTLLTVLVVLVMSASVSFADQGQQIQQLRAMLDKQAQLDTKKVADKDIEMARKWLKEAEVLVANGDERAAKRRLMRAEFAVDLVRALVAASVIRQKAEEQESAAYSAPETAAKLKQEVDELQQRKAQLQRELQQLRQ